MTVQWREEPEELVLGTGIREVKALRHNQGKPQLSYLLSAPEAIKGLCEVFAAGSKKYSRDNWKKGFPTHEVVDCLLRHLTEYMSGEERDVDPETGEAGNGYTGCLHIDQVVWNALVLAEQHRTFPDRRPGVSS